MNDLVDLEEKVIMEELNFDEKEKTYGKVWSPCSFRQSPIH